MLSSKLSSLVVPICIVLLITIIPTLPSASADVTREACDFTPDPDYCRSVLPNQTANVYDSCRSSVTKSMSESRKFLSLIDNYLNNQAGLTGPTVQALEDCRFLAGLNSEFLLTSYQTVGTTSRTTLPVQRADDVSTILSAVLTNQQTCFDGLQASGSGLFNGLSALSNDTKLYSVSLALFTQGWVPQNRKSSTWQPKSRHLPPIRNGRVPLKMTEKKRRLYESVTSRKLLQSTGGGDQVLVSDIVTVSQDGTGDFTTITDAVNAAPNNTKGTSGYFVIHVTAGEYEEYVSIAKNKKYLMMIGDGIGQTIITGNRSVVDGWTTFNSATFIVTAPNFVGFNFTIRNTAGAIKHQAVALRNGADLSAFYSCSFEAYQDTLYTHSLRQFYSECDIYGTVDFIFGNAAVVLQDCNIYPRLPMSGQFNAITAQGRTDVNQNTGTSIHNCTIRAADDLAAATNMTVQTYLGRPWKEYSRTVFMESFMDGLINTDGWRAWNGDFALTTLYYAEYGNSGPGSNTTGRVTWAGYQVINATDAGNFSVGNFLAGDAWLPNTGVPYTSGLLSSSS